jgi:hypothetical protein
VTVVKETIQVALAAAAAANDTVDNILGIVSNITTIGALAIFVLAASVICGMVELVSCLVACCVSGKSNAQQTSPQYGQYGQYTQYSQPGIEGEKGPYQVGVTQV